MEGPLLASPHHRMAMQGRVEEEVMSGLEGQCVMCQFINLLAHPRT